MSENYNTRLYTKQSLIEVIVAKDKEILELKKKNIYLNEYIEKTQKKLDAALEPKILCLAKTEINVSSKVLDGFGCTHTKSIGVGTKWIFNKSEAERLKSFGSVEILEELSDEKFLTRLKEIETEFKKESKENYELYTNLLEKSKRMEVEANAMEAEANALEEENKQLKDKLNSFNSKINKLLSENDELITENKELTKDILRLVRKYVK